eukprot:351886-Chlamydomonas_euryale.AAC.1
MLVAPPSPPRNGARTHRHVADKVESVIPRPVVSVVRHERLRTCKAVVRASNVVAVADGQALCGQ